MYIQEVLNAERQVLGNALRKEAREEVARRVDYYKRRVAALKGELHSAFSERARNRARARLLVAQGTLRMLQYAYLD